MMYIYLYIHKCMYIPIYVWAYDTGSYYVIRNIHLFFILFLPILIIWFINNLCNFSSTVLVNNWLMRYSAMWVYVDSTGLNNASTWYLMLCWGTIITLKTSCSWYRRVLKYHDIMTNGWGSWYHVLVSWPADVGHDTNVWLVIGSSFASVTRNNFNQSSQ